MMVRINSKPNRQQALMSLAAVSGIKPVRGNLLELNLEGKIERQSSDGRPFIEALFLEETLAVNEHVDRIRVVLNSPGGLSSDGLRIYRALRGHGAPVHVHVRQL